MYFKLKKEVFVKKKIHSTKNHKLLDQLCQFTSAPRNLSWQHIGFIKIIPLKRELVKTNSLT